MWRRRVVGLGGSSRLRAERGNQVPDIEQVGPQARIQAELAQLESHHREFWFLIIFAAVVLLLGFLSFFFPHGFWYSNSLHVSLSPQVLFVIMVGAVLVALAYIRRDIEIRGLRLASIQQYLAAQEEQAVGMQDAVTKVFTRNFLRDLLGGEISRAERTNRPLALIMCDVNNFKQVNDQYGHLMGDFILSQIAAILKSCVRGSDFVIRYGGDEFLLLLPETDEAGGQTVRQRVNRKVAEWDHSNRLGNLSITVSLGLYLHVTGQAAEKDVAEADARMYAEKQAAKRSAVADSQPLPE